jgi:hypothetical protein
MALMQLYYTSCEHGLSGYPGYQFNASTPDVPPETMREVERLTAYEPPAGLAHEEAAANLGEYPVNLSSWRGDTVVVANVVFVGTDFSNRFGNYFVHALVGTSPLDDLGGALPIELWQAPVWTHAAVTSPVLPALPGPPPRGPLDREAVHGFLGGHPEAGRLPALLTAAAAAVAGGRAVVLVSHDTEDNACWIAAISYLLPDALVQGMSFTTYHRRPDYCPFHVIGTLADAGRSDALEGFAIFDFVNGECSQTAAHPLAELLAVVGPRGAQELWRRCEELADGPAASLDELHGPAAAAAATLGVRLGVADVGAASDWFVASAERARPSTGLTAMVAEVLLGHNAGDVRRLGPIVAAVRRIGAGDETTGLAAVEERLIDQELAAVAAGGTAGWVQRMDAPGLREHARRRCESLLTEAPPARLLGLLRWAHERGVPIGEPVLVERGSGLATRFRETGSGRDLQDALAAWPALRRGMVEGLAHLAGDDPDALPRLFDGEFGALLDEPEVAALPVLDDLRLTRDARRSPSRRIAALAAMLSDRPGPRRPVQLEDVLARLWPDGRWQVVDAIQALGVVPARLQESPALVDWLAPLVLHPPDSADGDRWDDYRLLCRSLAAHPIRNGLPAAAQDLLGLLRRAEDAERLVTSSAGRDADLVAELAAELRGGPPGARQVLARRLPDLLLVTDPAALATALLACPQFAVDGYLRRVAPLLGRSTPDPQLAGALFVTVGRLETRGHPFAGLIEDHLLRTLPRWRSSDLDAVHRWIEGRPDPQAGMAFESWREQHVRVGLRGHLRRLIRPSRGKRGPTGGD